MNKVFRLFFFYLLITNCSLDQKSGLWTKLDKVENDKDLVIIELFKEDKNFDNELNSNVRIQIKSEFLKNNFINNLSNNSGQVNYDGNLKTVSKYKFSKIDNFNKSEPEVVFDKKNLIFFDNKGSILKFDQFAKLVWKKNYYKKSEKKLKPVLNMVNDGKYLIVTDNLAKYYLIDIENGNLLWMKRNAAPFNSQIKIYKGNFFVTDFKNILRCYSIKTGEELWNVKTDNSFVKSQKKLSLVISEGKVFFSNSLGDISAADIDTGKLIWQTPTQDSSIYESSFQLKTSDIVKVKKSIFFSNNTNEFYSLDIKTGTFFWTQKINSVVRPTVIDNLIYTITEEGFLVIMESDTGNIIRITNVFGRIKEKKRLKITPIGFVVGSKNIYLTTSNGRLIVIDILTGKPVLMIKIDNENISKPFIFDKKLIIIKDSAIIKLD